MPTTLSSLDPLRELGADLSSVDSISAWRDLSGRHHTNRWCDRTDSPSVEDVTDAASLQVTSCQSCWPAQRLQEISEAFLTANLLAVTLRQVGDPSLVQNSRSYYALLQDSLSSRTTDHSDLARAHALVTARLAAARDRLEEWFLSPEAQEHLVLASAACQLPPTYRDLVLETLQAHPTDALTLLAEHDRNATRFGRPALLSSLHHHADRFRALEGQYLSRSAGPASDYVWGQVGDNLRATLALFAVNEGALVLPGSLVGLAMAAGLEPARTEDEPNVLEVAARFVADGTALPAEALHLARIV